MAVSNPPGVRGISIMTPRTIQGVAALQRSIKKMEQPRAAPVRNVSNE
jgi:hypothetical protein